MLVEYGHFEVVDLPVPDVGPNEVRIRVRACGICGSDVHGMDGSTGRRVPPIVMGHEAAGEIEAVGRAVHDWTVGQRVTFDSTIFCGQCRYCRDGRINLCDNRQVLGVSCAEYRRQGAFAEYVTVPAHVVHALPEGMPYPWAAMAEPVSVAVHAVNRAGVRPGDRLAVLGAGMIGALVIQVARAKGVGEIVAVDVDPVKRESAHAFGADRALAACPDREFDVAIEAVGISQTVTAAVECVRNGGSVGLVGNLSPTVSLPLQTAVTREITLFGSCASQGNYPESLDLIASGGVRVAPMISAEVPLTDAATWFQRLGRREPGLMKVVVCP